MEQSNENDHSTNRASPDYDVLICGAGLAGLTLARQLRRRFGDSISIGLVDRTEGPLPQASCKVGESTVVGGSDYLHSVLDLHNYLYRTHIQKLGLRYFVGGGNEAFSERPEYGRAIFRPEVTEWQLDRGVFENDLRQMNAQQGIQLLEGTTVKSVEFSDNGAAHNVAVVNRTGSKEVLTARWVVDATGRRRLITRQLDLAKKLPSDCSSSWFRVGKRINVSDFVSAENHQWHARVPGNYRQNATCHLMGQGYWLWIIPLPGDFTSIGLVASEQFHAWDTFNTFERLVQWIDNHEPVLGEAIKGIEPLDFLVMRKFSHSATKVFSSARWACVGEAGCFADPFYSLGTNCIAVSNTITTELIGLDLNNQLDESVCSRLSDEYLATVEWITRSIQRPYRYMDSPLIMGAKLLWDFGFFLRVGLPMFHRFNGKPSPLDDEALLNATDTIDFRRYMLLNDHMLDFLDEWAERTKRRSSKEVFQWIEYFSVPFVWESHTDRPTAWTADAWRPRLRHAEILAQAIFLLAVEDVLPEHLQELERATWLDPWAIGLNPSRWESAGLVRDEAPTGADAIDAQQPSVRQQVRAALKLA